MTAKAGQDSVGPNASGADNIFLASMPKAGTHLAAAVLKELFGTQPVALTKNGDFADVATINKLANAAGSQQHILYGHFRCKGRLRELLGEHWRILALIRDPRDVVLSMRDYLETSKSPVHQGAWATIASLSHKEQIKAVIAGFSVGDFTVGPVTRHVRGFLEWQAQGAYIFRYEQFWSSEALQSLSRFLPADPGALARAVDAVLGQPMRSSTLNKGIVSRWRAEMDDELISFFKDNEHGCVQYLGYDWN